MPGPVKEQPFASSFSRWFFGIAILLVLYAAYRLVQPFLIPIFLAVVLVVVGSPLYGLVLKITGNRRSLASLITIILFIIIIILPLYLMAGIIASQAYNMYSSLAKGFAGHSLKEALDQGLGNLSPYLDRVQDVLGIDKTEMLMHISAWVRKISGLLYSNLAGLVAGITNLIIDFVLMMIVTAYLLVDGQRAADRILALSPLPSNMTRQIRDEVLAIMRATLTGTVVIAILQGILGGLGFWTFGIPNAPFWGTVMVFSSVVPIVGTALVWIPAGVYLLLVGLIWPGVGLMVWCLLAAVVCDNFLRPKLIGNKANLHPLLVFFSVLGGLVLFGVVGLLLGPMVLALLLSLLEVYRLHFLQPPLNACEQAGTDDDQEQNP